MTAPSSYASQTISDQPAPPTIDTPLAHERVELLMKTLARIMKQIAPTNPEAVSQTGEA